MNNNFISDKKKNQPKKVDKTRVVVAVLVVLWTLGGIFGLVFGSWFAVEKSVNALNDVRYSLENISYNICSASSSYRLNLGTFVFDTSGMYFGVCDESNYSILQNITLANYTSGNGGKICSSSGVVGDTTGWRYDKYLPGGGSDVGAITDFSRFYILDGCDFQFYVIGNYSLNPEVYYLNLSYHWDTSSPAGTIGPVSYYTVTSFTSTVPNSFKHINQGTKFTFYIFQDMYIELTVSVYDNNLVDKTVTYYLNNTDNIIFYNNGYNTGYANGLTDGQSIGATENYDNGYFTGYHIGYNNGAEASGNYTFMSLFGSIVDAPITAISNLLDFEIFGVDMSVFAFSVFSFAVLITVLKLIL